MSSGLEEGQLWWAKGVPIAVRETSCQAKRVDARAVEAVGRMSGTDQVSIGFHMLEGELEHYRLLA
jgi:hypothetical protein